MVREGKVHWELISLLHGSNFIKNHVQQRKKQEHNEVKQSLHLLFILRY